MAFCNSCGANLDAGAKFCAKCGVVAPGVPLPSSNAAIPPARASQQQHANERDQRGERERVVYVAVKIRIVG